jgi:hypothetical protein
LQLVLGATMLAWLPEWYDPDYGLKIVRLKRRLPAHGERPLFVLVLGTSRTQTGLQGRPAERVLSKALGRPVVVFNFGLAGTGPIRELLTLRRILADVGRPDLLLIEVLPPLLADRLEPPHELTEPMFPTAQRRPDELSLVRRCCGAARSGLCRDWWAAWALPCYTHRINILRSVLPDLLDRDERIISLRTDASGWFPFGSKDLPADVRRRSIRHERESYGPPLADFCITPQAVAAMLELLEVCRAEGLRTALFVMPEAREFRSWYPPAVWPEVERFLGGLGNYYGFPVISAREWMADDDFVDSHHLAPRTAPMFSERFGREVIAPLLEVTR